MFWKTGTYNAGFFFYFYEPANTGYRSRKTGEESLDSIEQLTGEQPGSVKRKQKVPQKITAFRGDGENVG